ncbi:hypothetical protein ACFL7M_17800 [Thermodesulfobacteriota bacterium]
MWKKKEEKKEEKVENLLKELCGDDAKLYDFLRNYMLIDPLSGISKKDLDILTEEAEKSGNFREAVDKAIFEAAQNPGERERYIKVIQNLASKTIHATEQEKEKAEKEGLTDWATSLGSRIENQKFMSERAEDIINTASKYYNEKLVELGENVRREERKESEGEEKRKEDLEKAGRETRKNERRKMGRKEKREAKKQDKREELEAKERKEERGREAEREEKRIGELEKAGRETRKNERRGN